MWLFKLTESGGFDVLLADSAVSTYLPATVIRNLPPNLPGSGHSLCLFNLATYTRETALSPPLCVHICGFICTDIRARRSDCLS